MIPLMLPMNALWGLNDLIWPQAVADSLNAVVALAINKRFYIAESSKEEDASA